MTAKQKAARANFKKAVTEAQKLRKSNPKLTQAQALKQAFAKNKKVGAVKKKAAPKKAAPKKAAPKKSVEVSKMSKKQLQNALTKKLSDSGISKDFLKNNFVFEKLGSIKKKKAAPKKIASKRITDIHKDSKSHNVNIRVLSGIKSQNKKILKKISIAEDELYDVEIDIINERLDLKNAIISKDKNLIKYEKDNLEFSIKLKKELIAHIKELKKLL